MKKEDTKQIVDNLAADHIDLCPHCGAKVHLEMEFNESYYDKNQNLIYYILFRCKPCKKLVLKTCQFTQNKYSNKEFLTFDDWKCKFPEDEVLFVKKFEGVVPQDILDDFQEGVSCLSNKNLRAAVSMFRRSLQSALIDLGATKNKNLVNQIKNIPLTDEIKDWAHNIRILGNWGAHPQDDNLKDISQEKAKETQSFLEEFLNYKYVMPHRVKNARNISIEKEGGIEEE